MKLYLREWRRYKDLGAPAMADALEIERESYLKIERETWRVGFGEAIIIAKTLGIDVSQLQFHPPKQGDPLPESADAILEGMPENLRQVAFAALKGIAGQ